ncbi:MAG: MBL fold metallo-hydrolase [Deltaproteobacteria bacterium]|nr:MBL fold metallo-hydrolase [Deltaproteobacteria bacterium]
MLRSLRLLALALVFLLAPAAQAGELKVYFFDIGQGDSSLIVSPTGKTVLIDSGPPDDAAKLKQRLSELLTAPIDLVILTHPHLDHLGGMEQALSVRGAQTFMDSGFNHPSPAYSSLLRYLESHNIKVVNATQGRNIDIGGGATLALLGPPSPFFNGTRSDPNANSVVARLTFGSEHVLFTGDAEEETEQMLIRGGDIQSDVLKVPHHGSRHSSTPDFLAAVKPRFAVISVGAGNDYGHPTRAALDRLEGVGAKIFRTDLDGEVRLVTDGKNLEVYPAKDAPTASAASAPEPAPVEPKKPHQPKGKVIEVKKHGGDKVVASVDGGFVASKNSKVFHKASCGGAEHIKAENKVNFATRKQALASGREPAKDCNP